MFAYGDRRAQRLCHAVQQQQLQLVRLGATTATWSGAGDGTSWNSTANWTGAVVPRSTDTAVFTDTGTSGKTINLNANETISQLTISTTNGFTIGNSSQASR